MAGLLDNILGSSMDDPKTLGLLALAQSLQAAPKVGQGLTSGLLGYQQAIAQAKQAKQMEEARAAQMQMQQLQLDQAKRAEAQQMALEQAAKASMISPAQSVLAGGGGPSLANAQKLETAQPSFDWAGYASRVAGIDPMKSLQIGQALKKEQPKLAKMEPMRGPDGQLVNVAVFEDGTTKILPYGVRPEMVLQDLGGKVAAIDKNSLPSGMSFSKSADPNAQLSASVTMRGQDMTDSRARELNAITKEGQQTQIINDPVRGPLLVNKGTGLTRNALGIDGKPIQGESQAKKEAGSKALLPVIDEAEKLVDSATGSYAGNAVDKAAQVFGAATPGAKASARLKVLEGQIMLNQPRMEGPQSDKDVALYRQMAGQIGDPNVPASIKKAALQEIKAIHQRYSGAEPSMGGVKFLGFE